MVVKPVISIFGTVVSVIFRRTPTFFFVNQNSFKLVNKNGFDISNCYRCALNLLIL